jgi:two-component system KDP operon response regulator KdpE
MVTLLEKRGEVPASRFPYRVAAEFDDENLNVCTTMDRPIIVLSARAGETDKIGALDAGADDYLTKPFGVGELLARVRATLRRQRQPDADPDGIFRFGDVQVDLKARLVTRAGQPVHLTPTEYRLLGVLVANAGRVVTSPQLLREVWGPSHSESGLYLRIYMGIWQKLEDDPAQPRSC